MTIGDDGIASVCMGKEHDGNPCSRCGHESDEQGMPARIWIDSGLGMVGYVNEQPPPDSDFKYEYVRADLARSDLEAEVIETAIQSHCRPDDDELRESHNNAVSALIEARYQSVRTKRA